MLYTAISIATTGELGIARGQTFAIPRPAGRRGVALRDGPPAARGAVRPRRGPVGGALRRADVADAVRSPAGPPRDGGGGRGGPSRESARRGRLRPGARRLRDGPRLASLAVHGVRIHRAAAGGLSRLRRRRFAARASRAEGRRGARGSLRRGVLRRLARPHEGREPRLRPARAPAARSPERGLPRASGCGHGPRPRRASPGRSRRCSPSRSCASAVRSRPMRAGSASRIRLSTAPGGSSSARTRGSFSTSRSASSPLVGLVALVRAAGDTRRRGLDARARRRASRALCGLVGVGRERRLGAAFPRPARAASRGRGGRGRGDALRAAPPASRSSFSASAVNALGTFQVEAATFYYVSSTGLARVSRALYEEYPPSFRPPESRDGAFWLPRYVPAASDPAFSAFRVHPFLLANRLAERDDERPPAPPRFASVARDEPGRGSAPPGRLAADHDADPARERTSRRAVPVAAPLHELRAARGASGPARTTRPGSRGSRTRRCATSTSARPDRAARLAERLFAVSPSAYTAALRAEALRLSGRTGDARAFPRLAARARLQRSRPRPRPGARGAGCRSGRPGRRPSLRGGARDPDGHAEAGARRVPRPSGRAPCAPSSRKCRTRPVAASGPR